MSAQDEGETQSQRLGRKLKEARLGAGYRSQQAFADEIKIHRTAIARFEAGTRPISAKVLKLWCEACSADYELFEPSARLVWVSKVIPVPDWFQDFDRGLGLAHTVRCWQPVIIHGLLQTPAYATAAHEGAGMEDDLVSERVSARIGLQQKVLDRLPPPKVIAIMDEVVLRRQVSTREIMAAQCRHLVELGKRRSIGIRVIHNSQGGNAGNVGPFTIASLADGDVALKDAAGEDITTDKRSDIRFLQDVFDRVGWVALSVPESLDLIARIGEEWTQ